MMLRQISIHGFVAGKSEADAGGDEAMGFLGGIFADDGERDLAGLDVLQTFAARNQFAIGRKNRGNANDVARGDARVAEGELKARKSFTMFTDAFGEEDFLSDERHGAGLPCLRTWCGCEKIFPLWKSNKKVLQCQSNSGPGSRKLREI